MRVDECKNRTLCGDNATVLSALADSTFDMVLTSPPYDDMDKHFNPLPLKGMREYDTYSWDFVGLVVELYRTLKPGGVVVWIVNDPVINGGESLASARQKIFFVQTGFRVHDTMIYNKNASVHPDARRYYQTFEYIIVFSKGAPKTFNPIRDRVNKSAGRKPGIATFRQVDGTIKRNIVPGARKLGVRFNVWTIPIGHGRHGDENAHAHPASFPEVLARDLLVSWSKPGDLILDPFMGSGTTGKVALQTGRDFIGIELSPKYTDIANQRTGAAPL